MMKYRMFKNPAGKVLATTIASLLPLLGYLRAQDQPATTDQPQTDSSQSSQEIEAMVVTGSIIPQSEVATSLPVTTFDRKFIENTGATTVTQLLQKLPQSTGARFRETVNTGVSFSPGAAAISLRGLNVNARHSGAKQAQVRLVFAD